MPTIDTALLTPDAHNARDLSYIANQQIYCGLDSCVTLELRKTLEDQYGPTNIIYDFERAMQGPYLEIMQRGFRVDQLSRHRAAQELHEKIDQLTVILDEFSAAIWDRPLNPNSPKQLQEFFYKRMHLPEQWINQKGERKLSMNREVMEKLDATYLFARPFTQIILEIRNLLKQLQVFETEIDLDGRFRTSYNIAGTETGRPSSSENAFGTGGNAQNIAPSLRYVFVADPGYKLCVIDLEQVEARDVGFFVGNLFGDWKFLDNCESGDLHTNNAKLVWSQMNWSGEQKADREIADKIFYRDFSFRDMAKRGGHLSNYYGTPFTMARSMKIPQEVATEFQARYVRGGKFKDVNGKWHEVEPAFPGIARWWQWTAERLQLDGKLITPFGRTRHFFGRPDDDTTLREAIAFLPQSTTADRMNLGLWKVWRYMPEVELLAQTYDSITFQYPEHLNEDTVINDALQHLKIELKANNGRSYVVPGEAKTGWNWGYYADENTKGASRLNLDGLKKWKSGSKDTRTRTTLLNRLG